jgi:integrase
MSQSTGSRRSRKATDRPKKPYQSFPLTPHASGTWQKKILGKTHYFGKWGRRVNGKLERIPGDGWKEALEIYEAQAADLHAGTIPSATPGALTLIELCNEFLKSKERKQAAGELSVRMFADYKDIKNLLVATFGEKRHIETLTARDFGKLREKMAEKWGPVRLGNSITRVKSFFKFGLDNDLIEKAIRYGSEFKKPDKAVLRKHRGNSVPKMIEPISLQKIIDAAEHPLRAMVLLGLNCGFGNNDCATLPLTAINLETRWIYFPRPKTGIDRRCPLWPETVTAIQEAIQARPKPKSDEDSGRTFISERGTAMVRALGSSRVDLVAIQFGKLLKSLGLHREGLGFYALRHVFRTVADAARDPVAIDIIMGHGDPSMGAHYRERVDDSRLRAVVDCVRGWLFGKVDSNKSQ